MSEPAPLLPLTRLDGSQVYIHVDRIVKITPSDLQSARDSGSNAECGSILTVETGTGTTSIEVTQYLLNQGPPDLARFLRLTDLHGKLIKINPAYVILVRSRQPAGTVLEIYSSTGTEEIYAQDSFEDVGDWWAAVARARLSDPGVHW